MSEKIRVPSARAFHDTFAYEIGMVGRTGNDFVAPHFGRVLQLTSQPDLFVDARVRIKKDRTFGRLHLVLANHMPELVMAGSELKITPDDKNYLHHELPPLEAGTEVILGRDDFEAPMNAAGLELPDTIAYVSTEHVKIGLKPGGPLPILQLVDLSLNGTFVIPE